MDEPREQVELTDPRALRALAHPTRLKLVGLLRHAGSLTATQAGERIGESAASCSFHLRQLAKWGLVEEAGGGRGRERPWRATARTTTWKVTAPELAEPASVLSSIILRDQTAKLLRSIDELPQWPTAWQEAYQLADKEITLSPRQLEELGRRMWEMMSSYDGQPVEAGARRVAIFFAALPELGG